MEMSSVLINVLVNHSNKITVISIQVVYTYNVLMKHIKPFYYLQLIL